MDHLSKLLDVLRNIPLWLTGSIAAGCLFILYGPALDGLSLEAVRGWPFFGAITIFAISLTIGQLVAIIVRAGLSWRVRRRPPRLNLIGDDRRDRSFWARVDNADGTEHTQIHLALTVHNPGSRSARIVKVRLRRPMFVNSAEILALAFQSPTQIGGQLYSSKGYIFASQSADCHIDAIVERKLGREGKPLSVTFDLIDEAAKVHRVRAKLLPSP